MRSAFNLFVFAKSMFTQFVILKGYVLSGEIAPKNNYYYYYLMLFVCIMLLFLFLANAFCFHALSWFIDK